MTNEHCYRVKIKVSVSRMYTFEGYVCVPVGREGDVDTFLINGDGFDWELTGDDTYVKPDWITPNLDITPFEWEVLYDTNEDELFDTPQKRRCRDCSYLIEGDNGKWVCDDCRKDIHEILDDDCSANQKW